MKEELTFGKFIIEKRKERDLSARQLALQINLSAVYICDIEKDRRVAPREDILEKIANILMLNKEEREHMFDLAARTKNTVSADLPEYIMEKDIVRVALRTAKENDIDDKEWQEFINRIRRKTND